MKSPKRATLRRRVLLSDRTAALLHSAQSVLASSFPQSAPAIQAQMQAPPLETLEDTMQRWRGLIRQNNLEEALYIAEKLMVCTEGSVASSVAYAITLRRMGKSLTAWSHLCPVLAKHPDMANLLYVAASCARAIGMQGEAERLLYHYINVTDAKAMQRPAFFFKDPQTDALIETLRQKPLSAQEQRRHQELAESFQYTMAKLAA